MCVGGGGGLASGLVALLEVEYAINSYVWVDIDRDAHAAVSHRLKLLRLKYPQLLLPEAIQDWESRLPMDARTISPKLFAMTIPEVIDLLLASPPMLAHHFPRLLFR